MYDFHMIPACLQAVCVQWLKSHYCLHISELPLLFDCLDLNVLTDYPVEHKKLDPFIT